MFGSYLNFGGFFRCVFNFSRLWFFYSLLCFFFMRYFKYISGFGRKFLWKLKDVFMVGGRRKEVRSSFSLWKFFFKVCKLLMCVDCFV